MIADKHLDEKYALVKLCKLFTWKSLYLKKTNFKWCCWFLFHKDILFVMRMCNDWKIAFTFTHFFVAVNLW